MFIAMSIKLSANYFKSFMQRQSSAVCQKNVFVTYKQNILALVKFLYARKYYWILKYCFFSAQYQEINQPKLQIGNTFETISL